MGGAASAFSSSQKVVEDKPEVDIDETNNEIVPADPETELTPRSEGEEVDFADSGEADFGRFTIEGRFDDASAGTDVRVLRILRLSQKEKNDNLLAACFSGETYEVELLLKHGAFTRRLDWRPFDTPYQLAKDGKHRWSPLHAAAYSGHRKIVSLLLSHGAPVNRANGWLRCPIHFAAEEGKRGVVQLLLKHGADPCVMDWQKYTPLHCAVSRGHRGAAQCLLDARADPNARTLSANTPLHLAARRGLNDIALMLLNYGADVNASAKKFTPLHEAAKECHSKMVALLLAHGADVDAQTSQRKTALNMSVLHRDAASEKLLIDAGAFAEHLLSAVVDDDSVDMDALLMADESHDKVAALGNAAPAGGAEAATTKSPFSAKSKFKGLSKKVAGLG